MGFAVCGFTLFRLRRIRIPWHGGGLNREGSSYPR